MASKIPFFRNQTRFHSFAPKRENSYANWFVDGASYMDAVADAIDKAQKEVFISDWWLSPEVNLKRPPTGKDCHWQLDKLLKRKAKEGVNIYVLLFEEFPGTLSNNSQYSESELLKQDDTIKQDDNIKVMRHHCNLFDVSDKRWSHHDKIVVVDQTTAFLGGIDLCFGRWDTTRHRLADLKHFDKVIPGNILDHQDPGAIRSNHESWVRNLGGDGVAEELSKLHSTPGRNEEKTSVNQQIKQALTEIGHSIGDKDEDTLVNEKDSSEGYQIWVGKDYTNYLVKDFTELEKPFEDNIDRKKVPRMPWHDIGAAVHGKAAEDVASHFIERWNFVKKQLNIFQRHRDYPLLSLKSDNDVQLLPGVMQQAFPCNVQIVRSSSNWSVGLSETECSIQTAYLDLIKNAQHYIYIENQFFCSKMDSNDVYNNIAQTLYDRIMKAHKNEETFRVFVIMPLLPGFAGHIETGADLQIITRLNYESICRGEHSLLGKLSSSGIKDPSKYISFHGLRTHEKISEEMHTEFIYVHAKLMIVDDKRVIIGSANINDRSMLGDRDSEIAVVVEDTRKCKTVMNGKTCEGGRHFASSLRKQLFREHLGLRFDDTSVDISDPVCESFFKDIWIKQASDNTAIYDKVFKCIPNDECTDFQKTAKCRQNPGLIGENPVTAEVELQKVKGHLVLFPLSFLKDADLTHWEEDIPDYDQIFDH